MAVPRDKSVSLLALPFVSTCPRPPQACPFFFFLLLAGWQGFTIRSSDQLQSDSPPDARGHVELARTGLVARRGTGAARHRRGEPGVRGGLARLGNDQRRALPEETRLLGRVRPGTHPESPAAVSPQTRSLQQLGELLPQPGHDPGSGAG